MEKTTKDKTIEELLNQRKILIEKVGKWYGGYNILIPQEITKIDNLIKQLNEIKS